MDWYLIHTKPRQESRAALNLAQQGYQCYLPLMPVERLRQRALTLVLEPLFSRYLFIQLDTSHSGQNWGPIRSTKGVARIVTFGNLPARVPAAIIDTLRAQDEALQQRPQRHFSPGETLRITQGPFTGIEAVYQMADGERRALVLIEMLSKPVALKIDVTSLHKVD